MKSEVVDIYDPILRLYVSTPIPPDTIGPSALILTVMLGPEGL